MSTVWDDLMESAKNLADKAGESDGQSGCVLEDETSEYAAGIRPAWPL